MKLRNKKTGKIVDLSEGMIKDAYNGEFIEIVPVAISNKENFLYGSLAELNEDWEDYEPVEPIIRDPKIRKAVRAWSEANGVSRAYIVGLGLLRDESTGNEIKFNGQPFFGWVTSLKSITELCGEEEE